MIITVASGKGGTGKTTVKTALALAAAEAAPTSATCRHAGPSGGPAAAAGLPHGL